MTKRPIESAFPSSNLGDALRSQQLSNRVDAAVEKDITASVQQDLGNRAAPTVTIDRPIHPLVGILKNPNNVRQAIMLNEILQRPKALR
jgi:hypothetical protein